MLNGGMQVHNQATGHQCTAVFRPQNGTAACSQHQTATLHQLCNDLLLTVTKPPLAFQLENQGNAGPGALLDHPVGILESQPQFSCQQPADGAFTCPHRPNQSEVTLAHHINGSG